MIPLDAAEYEPTHRYNHFYTFKYVDDVVNAALRHS